jgi:hypothetical protein
MLVTKTNSYLTNRMAVSAECQNPKHPVKKMKILTIILSLRFPTVNRNYTMAVKQFKKINKDFNEPRAVRRSLVHQL